MADTVGTDSLAAANTEAIEAWDGPLFDRFLRFRHIVTTGLAGHGDAALRMFAPQSGQSALDIGCGFGDTTQQIAALLGPEGRAVGVDASPRFIERAEREAVETGADNVRFEVADVQAHVPGGPYDLAFSRFGTMFFANPVAALRNVHAVLVPDGRLVMVVWRRRIDNEWLYRAQTIVENIVARPQEYDEPTCGPGPFSMADADTVSDILLNAGFTNIELHRYDLPIMMGSDLDEASEIVMALGPAGELLRLAGDRAAHLHGDVRDALQSGMADLAKPDGVWGHASTWIVSALTADGG